MTDSELTDRFADLVNEYGNIAQLARETGFSRRAIEYKRDGLRPVKQRDIMVVERALQLRD